MAPGMAALWVVNTMFVSAVREIMRNVYGYDDTDTDIQTVTLRIVFLENQSAYHDGIRMFGKTIRNCIQQGFQAQN